MSRTFGTWFALGCLSLGCLGCEEPALVHQDIPSDGICIEAAHMFGQPEPGPCAPGIAHCRTGPERRVAYDERGIARLSRECADSLEHTP
ncbi:MAG: hypothetical protein AB8I08_04480 [Sandaracinaceae bacterium]